MTLHVRFGPEAIAELEHAIGWYDQQRPGLGLTFLAAVDRATVMISAWPKAGTPFPEAATDLALRRTRIPGFPYHLVYMHSGDDLLVLAIAHDRRRPGYWRARVENQ